MAEIKKGILGGFSGTVGTVVGSNWRGKDIIRSRPQTSGKAPTELQMQQRIKFKTAISFLTPLRNVQSKFFGTTQGVKSRTNLATAYTIAEVIEMVNGLPVFNYGKVQVTKGDLAGFQNLAAAAQSGGKISYGWEDNSIQANAAAEDWVSSAVYCPQLGKWDLHQNLASRQESGAEHQLPAEFTGKTVHAYIWLNNVAENSACNSVYFGPLTVV